MSDFTATANPAGDQPAPSYALYGRVLQGAFPFTMPLPPAAGAPDLRADLRVHCTDEAPFPVPWAELTPTYRSHHLTPAGHPWLLCYEIGQTEVLRFAGEADFYLQPDAIICHLLDRDEMAQAELYLLGTVMARWLERQGTPVLHASAVVAAGGAVAFLASGQGGKSTLAAALMQVGFPLLTDDLLPVQVQNDGVMAHPGYPQLRFWPEQATHFLGDCGALPPVHPDYDKRRAPLASTGLGDFCPHPRSLRAVYLLDRQEEAAPIEIKPLSLPTALFSLVGHSFASRFVNAPLHQRRRLDRLRPVALTVPVRRLRYPSGNRRLTHVRRAILADLASS